MAQAYDRNLTVEKSLRLKIKTDEKAEKADHTLHDEAELKADVMIVVT